MVDNLKIDRTVKSVNWIRPGENSAFKRLSYLKSNMNKLIKNNLVTVKVTWLIQLISINCKLIYHFRDAMPMVHCDFKLSLCNNLFYK